MPAFLRRFALSACLALLSASAWAAGIRIIDPWVRGTVPGQTLSAAFLRVESPRAALLVAASSPQAREVRLIEMTDVGQGPRVAKAVEQIPIALGLTYLTPVTHYLQLQGLARPLAGGERIRLRLRFQYGDGSREDVEIDAVARSLGRPQ